MHISGPVEPITLIWASLERSFPPAEFEGDDVRSETKAGHGWLLVAQESPS